MALKSISDQVSSSTRIDVESVLQLEKSVTSLLSADDGWQYKSIVPLSSTDNKNRLARKRFDCSRNK